MVSVTQQRQSPPDEPEDEGIEEETTDGLNLEAPPGDEDQESESPPYVAPTPSKKDVKTAEKVWESIKGADIIGADSAVSSLLQLIDVHPLFTPPEQWPAEEEDEYCESSQLALMASVLIRGCPKLTVNPNSVRFLWRNKEKWVSGGKTVRGNVAKHNTRTRFLTDGSVASLEINFHHWKTLNPLQRTFALYHELRQLDQAGSLLGPDFTGFYDEMEVFGPRVFREMMELQRVVEIGARVEHLHQLPLFPEE